MTINKIKINSFGCHQDLELDLTPGVNVIFGENESGKSTLLAFVRAVLYGFDSRSVENPRKKYAPWGNTADTRFGGELTFTHMEKRYRAAASFTQSKRTDSITLYNDTTGMPLTVPDGQSIGEYILGLTASAFDCSVFAAQLKSRGDFSKDRSGLLVARLSAVSNKTPESSSAEADRRLKDALARLSSPRRNDGTLDKLIQRREALKESLAHLEDTEGRIGELAGDLEGLADREAKLESRRNYYLQFRDVKQAFAVLEQRKLLLRKHRDLANLSDEVEALKEPLDQDLYDIPVKRSKLLLFLAILLLLLFGGGVFFSVFFFLQSMPITWIIGCAAGTLLALCGSIICFIKSKRQVETLPMPEDDAVRLKELERRLYIEQEDFSQLLGDVSWEEYEQRWQEATEVLEEANLNQSTLTGIRQCSDDVLNEKLEKVTEELMELRGRISYTRACMDTLQATGGQDAGTDGMLSSDDIYEALEELGKKIADGEAKAEALTLARSVLSHSTEELQTTFGPIINMRTQKYTEDITGQHHGDIRISGEFDISLYDSANIACHQSSDFSGATEDQIFLALRCALTSLISQDEAPLPLYLDDPFVQYDDGRFVSAFRFLERFSEETGAQILLATCQSRVARDFPDRRILPLKGDDR